MFRLSAGLRGAAERFSEIKDEERKAKRDALEDAKDMVDTAARLWTTQGIDKLNTRRAQRREFEIIAKTLKNEFGFSPDQIDVALRQGVGENVITYSRQMRDNYGKTVDPSQIITFAEGYEDTGRNMAQVLDDVMGKVNSGTTFAEAIADIGGPNNKFLQARAENMNKYLGYNINEMMALAREDFTYGPSMAGKISMPDPAKQAAASTLDASKASSFERYFRTIGNSVAGVEVKYIDGMPQTPAGQTEAVFNAGIVTTLAREKYKENFERLGNQDQALMQTQEYFKDFINNYDGLQDTLKNPLGKQTDDLLSNETEEKVINEAQNAINLLPSGGSVFGTLATFKSRLISVYKKQGVADPEGKANSVLGNLKPQDVDDTDLTSVGRNNTSTRVSSGLMARSAKKASDFVQSR